MTLEEFYEKVGGSYSETLSRLRKDAMIVKYLGFFDKDTSYADLESAYAARDWKQVFAASHTLKGVAANLGLEGLRAAASDICENCREKDPDDTVQAQFDQVKAQYSNACAAIGELLASQGN